MKRLVNVSCSALYSILLLVSLYFFYQYGDTYRQLFIQGQGRDSAILYALAIALFPSFLNWLTGALQSFGIAQNRTQEKKVRGWITIAFSLYHVVIVQLTKENLFYIIAVLYFVFSLFQFYEFWEEK